MYRPLVSILTPAYNQGRFLEACVRSVQDQDYDNWEMVILDDASTDDTSEVAACLAASDPRIRYVRHEENYGIYRLAETYNEALAMTGGELVAILEADDIWLPGKLSLQVPMMELPDLVLAYGNRKLVDERGEVVGLTDLQRDTPRDVLCNSPVGSKYRHYLFLENRTPTETVIIRRSALERQGGFLQLEGCGTIDIPTFFLLAEQGPFAYTEEYLGLFRRHGGNSSLGRVREYKAAYLQLTDIHRERLAPLWASLGINVEKLAGVQRRLMKKHLARRECAVALDAAQAAMCAGHWGEARRGLLSAVSNARGLGRCFAILAQYVLTFVRLNILSRIRGR